MITLLGLLRGMLASVTALNAYARVPGFESRKKFHGFGLISPKYSVSKAIIGMSNLFKNETGVDNTN